MIKWYVEIICMFIDILFFLIMCNSNIFKINIVCYLFELVFWWVKWCKYWWRLCIYEVGYICVEWFCLWNEFVLYMLNILRLEIVVDLKIINKSKIIFGL